MQTENNMNLPDFIIVPYPLIADENIGAMEEKLYGLIYWFSKMKNEKCTASNTTLASLAKTSSGVVRNSLVKLEKNRYIVRTYKDKSKKVRDEIIPLISFNVSSRNDTLVVEVSSTDDRVSRTDDTYVSSTDAQSNNIYNNNNYIYKCGTSNETKKIKTWDKDEMFVSFYNLGVKKSPSKAFLSWNKLSSEEKELALKAMKLQVDNNHFRGRDGEDYIPHPTTWLNQRRWEDEVKIKKDAWK